jgi:hypothetical protein
MVARTSHKEPTQRSDGKSTVNTSRVRATSIYWNERASTLMCHHCDTSITLASFEAGRCACGMTLPELNPLPIDHESNRVRAIVAARLGATNEPDRKDHR